MAPYGVMRGSSHITFIINPTPRVDGTGLFREADTDDTDPSPETGENSEWGCCVIFAKFVRRKDNLTNL